MVNIYISAGPPLTPDPLFPLKYVKLHGFGDQVSLSPFQAPRGVTHEWTVIVFQSGHPMVMQSDATSLGCGCSQTINFLKLLFK